MHARAVPSPPAPKEFPPCSSVFAPPCALACLLAIAATAVGCGSSGFESPEACFQSIRVAAHNKDMRGICNCLTEESQETLAGMLVIGGTMMSKMQAGMATMAQGQAAEEAKKAVAAVDSVFEKHGVTEDALQENLGTMVGPPSGERLRDLAAIIKDKLGFITDMYAALEPLGQTAKFGEQFEEQIAGELKDVEVDGDQATAVVVTDRGEEPLMFRKTPAGWKLHIDMEGIGAGGSTPPA